MNIRGYDSSVFDLRTLKPQRTIVVNVDNLLDLQPGYCLEFTLNTGEQFTIMHTDDAVHVLSLGGLVAIGNGKPR